MLELELVLAEVQGQVEVLVEERGLERGQAVVEVEPPEQVGEVEVQPVEAAEELRVPGLVQVLEVVLALVQTLVLASERVLLAE